MIYITYIGFHDKVETNTGRNIKHSLLQLSYNAYRVSFPGVKRPGRGPNYPLPSSAEVKERVELYLYPPLGLYGLF
jgi:hypothetical protein